MPFIAWRVFGWEQEIISEAWGLRDFKNGKIIHGCNTNFCQNCEFIFCDIGFDENELSKLYKDYRQEKYNQERESFEKGYHARAKGLEKGYSYIKEIEKLIDIYPNNINILDIGGGDGKNTPFRKSNNCKIQIIDPGATETSYKNVEFIKKNNLNSNYDLICCLNVLEHVPYPIKFLNQFLKKVKSPKIYIEVPFDNFRLEKENKYWEKKRHWHEHINSFSKKSLIKLTERMKIECLYCEVNFIKNNDREEHIIQFVGSI